MHRIQTPIVSNLQALLDLLNATQPCCGNSDDRFLSLSMVAYIKALCWINQVSLHFVSVSLYTAACMGIIFLCVLYYFVTVQRNLWLPELIVRDLEVHQYFMLIVRFFLILLSSQAGAQLALNIASLSTQ